MGGFIEDFYYGRIEAQYWGEDKTGEFSVLSDSILSCRDWLCDAIRNEACCDALRCVEDYTAAWEEALGVACKNSFVNGFRYGAGFCEDALCREKNCVKST